MRERDVDPWDRATWEGARRAVLREGSQMSLPEKLAWLENAQRLAEQLAGGRASRSEPMTEIESERQ